ncbi:MAG TPA: glycosyltransferase [Acidimicrobiales bacterium]
MVIAPPSLAEAVEQAGYLFVAGHEPPEEQVAPIRERLPVVSRATASVLANRVLFGQLATSSMLPAMDRLLRDFEPDLVLRDPCEYASAVCARRRPVRTAQVGIGLAEVEWGSIDVAGPALEDHRPGLVGELRASTYLTRFPASLDPSPFADTLRYAEHAPVPGAALLDWWGTSALPLVYVSFGTVLGHMSLATEAYRTVLAAVAGIEARVLLTVGRHFDRTLLGHLPDNVHVEPWVDQADVLSEAELVVCHGGSGTTFGSLAAGVPVVIVPLFADQLANALRLTEAGAGLALDPGIEGDDRRRPLSRGDASRITEAIETVRSDPSYRAAAGRLASEMAAAPSPEEILDQLMTDR